MVEYAIVYTYLYRALYMPSSSRKRHCIAKIMGCRNNGGAERSEQEKRNIIYK